MCKYSLGLLTVLVVILLVSFIARRCSSALQSSSLIRALCILMILSFWSLADTSVTPMNHTSYVVSLQPDIRYVSPLHLPVAIPALLVLVLLRY